MIDWLKLRCLIPAQGKIPGDVVCIFTPEGELKWQKTKAVELKGSHEANVHVSACPVSGHLVIDGNPAKFFQGHNVFGSDDIHGLAHAIIGTVLSALDLDTDEHHLSLIAQDVIELARVDITGMYSVGSLGNARAAVRALGDNATMRYRGRGQIGRDGTAYWGKHSRRSATKAYAKGHELKDHPIAVAVPHSDAITEWAQDKLRVEHVFRGMDLKDRGLNLLANWKPETVTMLYAEAMGKLTVSDNLELAPAMIEGLKPRHRLVYASWLRGDDLRATLPARTFYRYRAELLEHGVDILTVRPSEPRGASLRLVNIITAVPATVPEWAIGTPAYFEPRRAA
jgi:II/X family phage/plasmid replication protein